MPRKSWEGPGRIPCGPIREALEHVLATTDLTLSEICTELGWFRSITAPSKRGVAETSKLKRCTGMEPTRNRNRSTNNVCVTYVSTITIENATAIARVIGVDLDELYEDVWCVEEHAAICKTCDAPMRKRHKTGQCGACLEEIEMFGRC